MSDDQLDRFVRAINQVEKLSKLLIAILTLIISGAVWAAQISSRLAEAQADIASIKPDVTLLKVDVSRVKGALGMSATGPFKPTPEVVNKEVPSALHP